MTTMTVTMVPPSLPPALSAEGGRVHLRVTLLLMHVPEGRNASLTPGDLLSLAGNNGNGGNGGVRGGGGACCAYGICEPFTLVLLSFPQKVRTEMAL